MKNYIVHYLANTFQEFSLQPSKFSIKLVSIIFIIMMGLSNMQSKAQGGMWTWMKGDSVVMNTISLGNYGLLGVPDPLNEIPGRYHGNYWTDKQGNFWVTGGQIFNVGYLNDLWKYDLATNIWTWMKGPQIVANTAGVFGVQGVPSVNNFPPYAGLSGNCWTDSSNNLWYLHARGDLWRYSISTNEWTWMKGTGAFTQAAVYGTIGVPGINVTPGFHSENKCAWVDGNNDLWLYEGGNIWKYHIPTNMWTWMKGPGAGAIVANYGTQGVPSITNQPAIGQSWFYWTDKDYKFYIGFSGFSASAVWRYDPLTNMWTWLNGNGAISGGTGSKYISQCVPSTDRTPGSRVEVRGAQNINPKYCSDYLWFCAGQNSTGKYNDLWVYKPEQNTWMWVSGDSVSNNMGNYGVKGVMAPSNMLPNRTGEMMWVDSLQRVWILGGIAKGGTSRANDLWRFTPDSACLGLVVDTFELNPPLDTVLCKNESTTMYIDTSYAVNVSPSIYYSANADTSILTFTPPVTTTYTVTVSKLVNNCLQTKSISFTIIVNDYPMPAFADAIICEGKQYNISLDTSYHFLFNPNASLYTPGGDSAFFSPPVTTTYTVTATKNGCQVLDTTTFIVTVLPTPIAKFVISPSVVEISNAQFQLTNLSQNANQYRWIVNNQLIDTTKNLAYTAVDTGRICFTLMASNQLGCIDSFTNCGEVLPGYSVFIPNAFSPNGDGINDLFKVIGHNITLKWFSIYNRWGEEVFWTDDINIGWDGKYKKVNADLDVYFYLVEYCNLFGQGFTAKGDVTLIR